jgi:Cof subfamily protein (haloacid dehalogenase superfamily)
VRAVESQAPQPAGVRKPAARVSFLIADVDGTLVTPDKELTQTAVTAAEHLHTAGIGFTLVSSRPPQGMAMFPGPLGLKRMFAAFDGAALVQPDLRVVEEHCVAVETAGCAIEIMRGHRIDVWLFAGNEWLVTDPDGPLVPLELRTLRYGPKVVASFEPWLGHTSKLVGSSRDYDLLARCEVELQHALGGTASVHRSQLYYLDVTHNSADKGYAVRRLAAGAGVPLEEVAVIGDMSNDVPMFKTAGLAIAMGNASAEVQGLADFITTSNADDGFARAVTDYILPRIPRQGGTA